MRIMKSNEVLARLKKTENRLFQYSVLRFYPFSAGRAGRHLPLGDDVPFVDPNKKTGIRLRRGHRYRPSLRFSDRFPCTQTAKKDKSALSHHTIIEKQEKKISPKRPPDRPPEVYRSSRTYQNPFSESTQHWFDQTRTDIRKEITKGIRSLFFDRLRYTNKTRIFANRRDNRRENRTN